MPAARLPVKGKHYDFCVEFLEIQGSLLKCMKAHVSTERHKLALTEARRRTKFGIPPPPPPPCPTPWANPNPHPRLSETTYNSIAQHGPAYESNSDSDSDSDSGSGSGSGFEISAPTSRACFGRYISSAADGIHLEQDPALNEATTETDEGFLESILNEDVLRGLDETPAWEPDNTVEATHPHADKDTYPWPDHTHYLTHMLFRSPELRFSRSQQREILRWANSCGMDGVPSLYSLDKCDQLLKECVGNPTRRFTSSCGNVYFMNSVRSAVQQDMSNPQVRNLMQFYPSDGEGEINEIWDGEKLAHGLTPEQLTPMVVVGDSHYFVNELCELEDGNVFLPEMFVRRQGSIWARGYDVECRQVDGTIHLSASQVRILRPTSSFRSNCIDICGGNMDIFKYDGVSSALNSA
ncbi:hypothetical protein BN14_05141 [Rhizoctonia solani AG-1 IB]|uniref:Uncharacterized protein n=1 Tax=Thanatephorus cucumeris (strain AG1-IB / isolate 7/3/14) TaxID=1108050 RepID=M5C5G6_THACB|nr:hypothetical protein BN14_05141 [Rhizoctonia solani AG-1 IB]